ncbi:MAG: type 1 glutamine amidotransferase [Gammaproteobacteria bacterium]|nr:type 1 glutamine amidotransferase [Gammaproteobacteria bacterium]
MKAHYLQHVPFEGLGSIKTWLQSMRADVSVTRFFEDPALPEVDALDLLVVMGGPMSVNDETGYPWLAAEKEFIRNAIDKDKAVIGICLGAQLIASAMGAAVYPNREKEIGWFPVTAEPVGDADDRFSFPRELLVFHWHGETFDLPEGALRLTRSDACENQAFQLGWRVIGMQFHLETTPDAARDIVHHCRDELQLSRYVQSEAEILGAEDSNYAAINAWLDKVLRFVTDS